MAIDLEFDWKSFAWIKRGYRRKNVLCLLKSTNRPLTATDVKKNQKIDITQAAFTLNELAREDFLKCLNPQDHLGKLYVLSEKGKGMAEALKRGRL